MPTDKTKALQEHTFRLTTLYPLQRLAKTVLLPLRFLSLPSPQGSLDSSEAADYCPLPTTCRNISLEYYRSTAEVAPGMPSALTFCVEDTVGLRNDKFMVGVIDRTFGDVDTHEPSPQRDYGDDIRKHDDIPRSDYLQFMKSGIPPRGTVLVSWQTEFKTELIPESQLELLDRALYVGDVVKRTLQSPMSGTVIGTKVLCTLFPATAFVGTQMPERLTEEVNVRGVPAEELLDVHEYEEGGLVIYDNWVGRIEDVYDEIAVRLSNNSVVIVESPNELDPDDPLVDRLSVGDRVKTKKGNLRRGRWKFGAFDPNIRPEGMVVETRSVMLEVRWLSCRIGVAGGAYAEPSSTVDLDLLDSGELHVYDATAGALQTLPLAANGIDRSHHPAELEIGDRVKFKDLTAAAVKYDGSRVLPNGFPQGRVKRIPRTDTLGYDLNVYLVMQTHTTVSVLWQDLTVTEDLSPNLIPDPNVEDDDEVWPGEIVCTKEDIPSDGAENDWVIRPAKVGVVQSVKPTDRIATVRWFQNPHIQFFAEDLIPPSFTGTLCAPEEDVSLYDIRSTPSITRRRGDFVMVLPPALTTPKAQAHVPTVGPNWFGEVIDLRLDGNLTVRLGAQKPVIDIQVPVEQVTLVYSSDMDAHFDPMSFEDDDYEDTDDEEEEEDESEYDEMWIEYEDGQAPMANSNEEDWSTEEEGDDDADILMEDPLDNADEIDTSNTTPESESEQLSVGRPIPTQPTAPACDVSEPINVILNTITADLDNASAPLLTDAQRESNHLEPFLILDTQPPLNHPYLHCSLPSNPLHTRRIAKEHKILQSSLPPDIYVRTWESRLDLIRVLMIGPSDTPYEYAPFMIDFHLGPAFPTSPPDAFFHSWTNGQGSVNPNLYEDGKICLSLLGTWHADERHESWSSGKSTLLQVLVSLLGLVLVKEPYYNEAGYEIHRSTPETHLSSVLYTERTYFRARAFISHALSNPTLTFESELRYLYLDRAPHSPKLLDKAINAAKAIIACSEKKDGGETDGERDGLRKISLGAVVMLKRHVVKLEELRDFAQGMIA